MELYRQAQRSLVTTYQRSIWNRFMLAVRQYELIRPGDRIAVCISGGKDSMLLAKLMQQLQRYGDIPFSLTFLVMDPGYSPANRQRIIDNAVLLRVPIRVFESNIFRVVEKTDRSPCYLCSRMRRGHLYQQAQQLGCNKIALGHHFNDVIETTLMALTYGGQVQTMLPKLHSDNFPGMELIRPLYCVREADIINWQRRHGLEFLQCACRMTDERPREQGSKRQKIKELIAELKKDNSQIEINIFQSMHHVKLETLLGYKTGDGVLHSFLDGYDDKNDTEREDDDEQYPAGGLP